MGGMRYFTALTALLALWLVTPLCDAEPLHDPLQASKGEGTHYTIKHLDVPTSPGGREVTLYIAHSGEPAALPIVEVRLTNRGEEEKINECLPLRVRLSKTYSKDKLLTGRFNIQRYRRFGNKCHLSADRWVVAQVSVLSGGEEKPARLLARERFAIHLPRPLRIALMGDSYAAGLGTGRYDLSDGKEEPGAFRSSLSGPERLIRELSRRFAIDYKNVAYAGGQTTAGEQKSVASLIEIDENGNVSEGSQLDQVSHWLGGKALDYIVVSTGGNDMYEKGNGDSGLKRVVKKAIFNRKQLEDNSNVAERIARGLRHFEQDLRALFGYLEGQSKYRRTTVVISTYPDMTKDENGRFANPKKKHGDTTQARGWSSYSAKDMEFLYNEVLVPLNDAIAERCNAYSMCKLNDVMRLNPEIRFHGMPSAEPWFNRFRDVGGGKNKDKNKPGNSEAFHPNKRGQEEIYFRTLRETLQPAVQSERLLAQTEKEGISVAPPINPNLPSSKEAVQPLQPEPPSYIRDRIIMRR